uniref:Tfp pilus assembly protein PilX n=1 Tax=mine drainage metagenome TaxID=410659 RepID=E6PLY5_9ZZZZ
MAALNHRAQRKPEQGFVLLLTLITLLVLLFGVLFTMRGTLLQTAMTGNTMQRQKDVQASDLALRQVQQAIIQTANSAGDVPLEIAATGKAWFYIPPNNGSVWPVPGTGTGAPATYWQTCQGNGTCDTVANVASVISPAPPALPGGYTALATVVPTNQPTDAYSCGNTGFTATYYDIFLHTQEANATTAATTETVFKLCTPTTS